MKAKRSCAALGVIATSALVLSGCGSDNNTSSNSGSNSGSGESGSVAAGDCGGKKTLKSSGSSAQANAMTRFINAYEKDCPGFTLNYTSSGSGAGVSEFLGGQTDFGGSDSPLDRKSVV